MADFVFLLGSIDAKAASSLVAVKDGVVSEAVVPFSRFKDPTLNGATHRKGPSVGKNAGNRRNESRSTLLGRNAGKLIKDETVILFVVAMLTAVSCGIDAGLTAESVNLKSRIISDRKIPGISANASLDQSILFEGGSGLLDVIG